MCIYKRIDPGDYIELASLPAWEFEQALMILIGYTYDHSSYSTEAEEEQEKHKSRKLVNELLNNPDCDYWRLVKIVKDAVSVSKLTTLKDKNREGVEFLDPGELVAFMRDNPLADEMLDLSVWDDYFLPTEKQIQASRLKGLGRLKLLESRLESIIRAILWFGEEKEHCLDDHGKITKDQFMSRIREYVEINNLPHLSGATISKMWRCVPSKYKYTGGLSWERNGKNNNG